MALIEINRNPSARELRQFAGIWLPAACAVIGYVVWVKLGVPTAALALWCVAVALGALGLARPALIRSVYIGWMIAVFPIGWVVSHVLLAIVYYLFLTPLGLGLRLCGKDLLQRKFDPRAASYWTPHQPSDSARYFRQF